MNPVVLYLVSGEGLYAGAGVLLLAVAGSFGVRNRWGVVLRNLAAWVGMGIMVVSSPPVGAWIGGMMLAAFGAWFILVNRRSPAGRGVAAGVLAALLVLVCGWEFSHRGMPRVGPLPPGHLTVIGDSISAGINPRLANWPQIFQQRYGIPVVNLARPGAGMAEAVGMAAEVRPEGRMVLIEMGGNDLLGDVPAGEFEANLRRVLETLRAGDAGRMIVMMELPLMPHKTGYGSAQRRLARRFGAHLIPKRLFIEVLAGGEATSDGLHLSESGNQRMAELIAQVLLPAGRAPGHSAGD